MMWLELAYGNYGLTDTLLSFSLDSFAPKINFDYPTDVVHVLLFPAIT